jgi:hypothetical protein
MPVTGIVAVVVGAFALVPPIPQDPDYHAFADRRPVMGVPNGGDVLSNLPFALVGGLGLLVLARDRRAGASVFADPWTRWPYAALFAGTALAAAGSAYYHLAPDNFRLVWDRMPITLGLVGLVTAVTAERAGVRTARRLALPLLAGGAASLAYWYGSEAAGAGDLRPYVLLQGGGLVAVTALVWRYPGDRRDTAYLSAGLAAYLAAKVLELTDRDVYALTGVVSGHTLKHLLAALAAACIVAMLAARRGGSPPPTARPWRHSWKV